MVRGGFASFAILILLTIPLAGCTQTPVERQEIESETLVEVNNPCSLPSAAVQQSTISIDVEGTERFFRLTTPQTDAPLERTRTSPKQSSMNYQKSTASMIQDCMQQDIRLGQCIPMK